MYFPNKAFQRQYIEWCRRFPFDLAITVNANRRVAVHRRPAILRAVDGRLNREFLGPRYCYLPQAQRIRTIGVPEEKTDSVHFHLAVGIPVDDSGVKKMIRTETSLTQLLRGDHRAQLLPGASIDVRQYQDAGWLEYICKGVNEHTEVYVSGLTPENMSDVTVPTL